MTTTFPRICPACGFGIPVGVELCPHHTMERGDWALGNRAWCDFIHRGVVAPVVERGALVPVFNWEEEIMAALSRAAVFRQAAHGLEAAQASQPRGR